MGIHNNTPNFTWISIKGLNIQKGDKFYSVEDIKTNLEHIYWELDNPSVLRPSMENLGTSGNRYLLYRNNSGEVIEVPNDDLKITYSDLESNPIFEERISSIVQKADNDAKKIVLLEQNVDGIKQTVGEWKISEDGTIKDNITQIKQTNNAIDLKVQETNKTINDNKFVNQLREKFNNAIIDFNAQLGVTDSLLYGYFQDNIITDEEEKNIKSLLSQLMEKKSEVILQTNEFIKLAEIQNQTNQKNSMISQRDKFSDSVLHLNNYINTSISDKIVTTTDITGVTNAISKCSTSLNTLKNTVNDFLFLGSGGKIIDELARIGIKSNEISISVSNTEELVKTTLGVEKNLLQSHIDDFKTANSDLKYKVNLYFKDGLVSKDELDSINTAITKLNSERNDISNKYNELYNNKYLTQISKKALKTEYDKFINKSNAASSKTAQYFADGFINDIEKNEIDILLNESISFLLELNTKMCQAIDEIDDETKKAELQTAKDEFKKEIDDVNKNVSNLNNYVDGTFKDNVIDENEKKILNESLNSFEMEKGDIDNTYNHIYSSEYLDGLKKTEFKKSYDKVNSKYVSLVDVTNSIINKSTLISNDDRNNIENARVEFNKALGEFSKISNEVVKYINDKQAAKLKGDFNEQLTELDTKMNGMQSDIETSISDGLIDDSEKISLKSNLEILYNEFAENEGEFFKVYNNPNLVGDIKTQLQKTYNDYTLVYGTLISFIDGLINKTTQIVDKDKEDLKTNFENYRKSTKVYSEKVYEAIENIKNKSIEDTKTALNKEISEVGKSVSKLENNMNTVFKDGVLSDSEKVGLKQNLQTVQKDKTDVDNGYKTVYQNADLLNPAKSNLKNAYDDYVSKYNNLVSATNNIINKIGIIDGTDQSNFNNAYANFKNASGLYIKRLNEALDSISERKKALAENNSRTYTDAQIKVTKELISSKVSKKDYDANNIKLNEKFTQINQSAETISLRVTDIQNDYTTSSELEQTKKEFNFKFQDLGYYNVLSNSTFKVGLNHWGIFHWRGVDGNYSFIDGNYDDYVPQGMYAIRLAIPNAGANNKELGYGVWQNVMLKANTKYTISGISMTHRVTRFVGEVKAHRKDGSTNHFSSFLLPLGGANNTMDGTNGRFHYTFTTPNESAIDHYGVYLWISESDGNGNPVAWLSELQIVEGEMYGKYIESTSEVYNDITTIDGEGVKVRHSNGDFTMMSSQGLKRHRSNGDAKGDYHYLTHYVGFVTTASTSDLNWIQLPDDFKGKHFTAYSVISDTWQDSWNWGESWVIQRFVTFVETSQIDYANARVPIRGYRIDKNYSTGERRTKEIAGVLLVIA